MPQARQISYAHLTGCAEGFESPINRKGASKLLSSHKPNVTLTMCLAVPGEILSITNSTATVDLGGIKQDVRLDLVDGATVGHYVLVHVGYAIQLMTPAEAKETFALFSEYAAALEQELEDG